MTAARVILWRHGQTAHNRSGIWQGQLDIELDDVGRDQAAAAAAALASSFALHGDGQVTIVSSDLVRASATATALASLVDVPVQLDPRLREVYAGRWQGLTREEIIAAGMAEELTAWRRGDDIPVGGGERPSEVGLRGAEAIREHAMALDGGTLVAVAHGGVLRSALLLLLGLTTGHERAIGGLGNARWAEVAPGDPVWRLLGYNVQAALEPSRFMR